MQNTKSDLIAIAAEILKNYPISTHEEDWIFPYKFGLRNRFFLKLQLKKLDAWHRELVFKIKKAADSISEGQQNDRTSTI